MLCETQYEQALKKRTGELEAAQHSIQDMQGRFALMMEVRNPTCATLYHLLSGVLTRRLDGREFAAIAPNFTPTLDGLQVHKGTSGIRVDLIPATRTSLRIPTNCAT